MKNIISIHRRETSDKISQCKQAFMKEIHNSENKAFPLRLAGEGERVRIVSLNGGRGFHDRLAGLGLRIGELVEVIQNHMDGKLLLGHEGIRLFLGGGMAQKIQVVIVKGGNQ
jgi:ferrous iron transport protein A